MPLLSIFDLDFFLRVPLGKLFWNPKGWQIGEVPKCWKRSYPNRIAQAKKRVESKPSAKLTKARPNTVPRKQTIMSSSHSHLPMFFYGSKFWAANQSQVTGWNCWYNQNTRTIYYLKIWVMTQGRYCIFCAYAANLYITRGAQVPQKMVSLLWSFWLRGRPPTKLGDWMRTIRRVFGHLVRSKLVKLVGWKSWKIWGCFRSPWMISTTRRIFPEASSFCPSQGQPSHPPAKSPR